MNKKGVSQIVTTILIILLVLAAIVIVWQAVKSTVESGAGEITGKTECIGVELDITNVVADTTTNTLTVSVTRLSGGADTAADVILLVDGTSKSSSTTTKLGQLESENYLISSISAYTKVEAGSKIGTNVCPGTASYP